MANIKDFIKKIGNETVSLEEQQQALAAVEQTIVEAKAKREESIGKNVDLVISALKKIESDLNTKLVELNNTPAKQGVAGPQGEKGRDGRDGTDGYKGQDGKDGVDGKDGKDGSDGISVTDAKVDFDGSLVITLSDGREIDAGAVLSSEAAKHIHSVQTAGTGSTSQAVLDAVAAIQATIATYGTMATQNANAVAITGGTINGITVGATTPAAGTFTTLTSSGTATLANGSTTYVTVTGDASYPMIKATGGTNTPLVLSPLGTGALQAQKTDSTATGGNARGQYAVDWQTSRNGAAQVASSTQSVVGGGFGNTASNVASTVAGGASNVVNQPYGGILSGQSNAVTLNYASVVGGSSNTGSGYYGFVGGGTSNSTTSSSAVTTQSATMNATTAVTLSGSNASIKVGQMVTGTSISFPNTYVAAISGTSLTLSQAASGSSTSTLSFYTPHGVVVGGGNNQATGSYSFIGGGGNAGTAALRNIASGDWSVVAGGSQNTASGGNSAVLGGGNCSATNSFAVCIGGAGNTASGFGSTNLGGNGTQANGTYSIAGGFVSTNRSLSSFAFAAGSASVTGDAQTEIFVIRNTTTDATATALTIGAGAPSTTNQVILPNNSAYYFRGEVVSGVTGGGDTKGWSIEGVIKRGANAASTALVGTPTVTSTYADAGASTWVLAVTADTTNGGLKVTFTGQASTTIRTVCQIRTTEMTY